MRVEAFGQNTASSGAKPAEKTLGKDEFIKLLITQLRYQDPLKPMEDKEFIAQMAQFSALEQMQNLNANISALQGLSLIGKQVTAYVLKEGTTEKEEVTGIVEGVQQLSGRVLLTVNGKTVPLESVSAVRPAPKSSPSVAGDGSSESGEGEAGNGQP